MPLNDKMTGTVVSEEETATGLGFESVAEFRRWQTSLGHKVSELEYALKQAQNEAEGFRWYLVRYDQMLAHASDELKSWNEERTAKIRKAINIVRGKEPDWDNLLKEFLSE